MPCIDPGIAPGIMPEISKGTALGIALGLELGIMFGKRLTLRQIINVNDHDPCDSTFGSLFIIMEPR